MDASDQTRLFEAIDKESVDKREILTRVWTALEEKGYEPLDQIVGYLVSGDPSYITAHGDARRREYEQYDEAGSKNAETNGGNAEGP